MHQSSDQMLWHFYWLSFTVKIKMTTLSQYYASVNIKDFYIDLKKQK